MSRAVTEPTPASSNKNPSPDFYTEGNQPQTIESPLLQSMKAIKELISTDYRSNITTFYKDFFSPEDPENFNKPGILFEDFINLFENKPEYFDGSLTNEQKLEIFNEISQGNPFISLENLKNFVKDNSKYPDKYYEIHKEIKQCLNSRFSNCDEAFLHFQKNLNWNLHTGKKFYANEFDKKRSYITKVEFIEGIFNLFQGKFDRYSISNYYTKAFKNLEYFSNHSKKEWEPYTMKFAYIRYSDFVYLYFDEINNNYNNYDSEEMDSSPEHNHLRLRSNDFKSRTRLPFNGYKTATNFKFAPKMTNNNINYYTQYNTISTDFDTKKPNLSGQNTINTSYSSNKNLHSNYNLYKKSNNFFPNFKSRLSSANSNTIVFNRNNNLLNMKRPYSNKRFEFIRTKSPELFSFNPMEKINKNKEKILDALNRLIGEENIDLIILAKFKTILKNLNINLTPTEIDDLSSNHLYNDNGFISLKDFRDFILDVKPKVNLQLINTSNSFTGFKKSVDFSKTYTGGFTKGLFNFNYKHIIPEEISNLKSLIYKYYGNPRMCFELNDMELSNYIDYPRFKKIIIDLCIKEFKPIPKDSIMKSMYDYVDKNKDGIISKLEWNKQLSLYKDFNEHECRPLHVSFNYKSDNCKMLEVLRDIVKHKKYIIDKIKVFKMKGRLIIESGFMLQILKLCLGKPMLKDNQWKGIMALGKSDLKGYVNVPLFFKNVEEQTKLQNYGNTRSRSKF